MSKVSIVIPVINLFDSYTKSCLDSIKSKHEINIILIDNHSIDNTQVEGRKLASNHFLYQRNEEAWSCAKSWNWGTMKAFERDADYVLIINNDIVLHHDCIDRMVERFERGEKEIVMVTAMDRRGDNPVVSDFLNLKSVDFESVAEAEHPHYSCFMINKEYWNRIGAFDEEFIPCYFEDNSSHYKIKLAGLKAIVYPPALFYHHGSRTWNEGVVHSTIERNLKFERNREVYVEMWGGTPGNEKFKTKYNK